MSTRCWENATATDVRHRRPLATSPQGKRSKYGAVKTTVDNIVFHSAKEAKRYGELKLLAQAGAIRDLELQPRFELTAGPKGTTLGEYVGDFRYVDGDTVIVEDVKGFKTPLYRWKKKHVEAQYGIQIREI